MTKPIACRDEKGREEFLATPRLGVLQTNRREGMPIGVPVWFEWDGKVVRMFAASFSLKIKRLRRDPKASLLVMNHFDEGESWVAFDGEVSVSDEGGLELAERLAPRYWDLEDPERQEGLKLWRSLPAGTLSVLTLAPTNIRGSTDH
jgi:nitroimidazol reductase NimA-like FMN-containing flavoprotein (pyridoxamine 5'-phosphate oxidase superfamily)